MIERLQSYFEDKFPQWSDIRITNITDITSGWETEIISFDLEYSFQNRQNNNHLIARVYPGNTGAHRAKFEFELLSSLSDVRYPVPHVLLVDTDSEIFERPFIIMQRIIGTTMMEKMFSGNGLIDPEMVNSFSTLFVQLHNLDWRKIAFIPERYRQSNSQSLFREHLNGQRDHITRYSAEHLSPIVDWLFTNLRNIEFQPVSLLHRDFHPMNILLDQYGNPFVIDWTAATLGDFRIDLAWTMLLSKLHFGHGLHELILDRYKMVAGTSIDDLDFFTVDACLRRLSDILISLKSGAESLGMRESTTNEMKRSIGLLREIHDDVKEITGLTIDEIETQIEHYQESS